MSLIARLGVILGINTSEFTSGMDAATNKTREFEMNQKRALRNAQRAQDELMASVGKGALAITGLALAVGKVFQYGDQIDETAKGFDVTTQSIIAMQAAFQDSGGQIEDAAGALQKLAIAQQSAKDGNEAMRESFEKLGISGRDVENLNLEDLFKRVAQELSNVEDSTLRVSLQTELLGKAVRGTNWKDFVSNYKELGDPSLLYAVQENAKAWGNIEATFRELLMVAQKLVAPFALLVNSISDIRKEYDRLKKGGSTEIDFGAAFGGMPGEAIVGSYGEAPSDANAKPIAKPAQAGGFKTQSEKDKNAAQKASEARRQMQLDIELIVKKAKVAADIFALDERAVMLGEKAVSGERLRLELASDLADIRAAATKERAKEGAQIDLINKKEAAQVAARVSKYNADENLRVTRMQREHQLTLAAIKEEAQIRTDQMEAEVIGQMDLLDVEKQRFELGSAGYDLARANVERENRLRQIRLQFLEETKAVNKEYELSAKTAQDLEVYETKIEAIRVNQLQAITWATAEEKTKRDVLQEQLAVTQHLLKLDIARQKARDVENIEAQLKVDSQRLNLEMQRYGMSVNQYNVATLLLDNANRLVDAERKYIELQREAYYEMQRQGGGQEAREQYEARIKAIQETRDIELQAIQQVNDMREEALQKDIERQRSWSDGWKHASMRFSEDAERAFDRGSRAFGSVMSNMNAAISNFVETGKFEFADFATAVIKDIIRMEMQAQAAMMFRMMLGSLGGFSMSKPNFDAGIGGNVGFAAAGGEIDSPTIVGENGPELFIPSQRGTVIPNTIAPSMASMSQPQVVYNGPYIENMSAIDTQSAAQFLSKNKMSVWAANKSADRSVPVSR